MNKLTDDSARLQVLFNKFYDETATPEEIAEVAELLHKYGEAGLSPILQQIWANEKPTDIFSKEKSDAIFNQVLSHRRTESDDPGMADYKVRRFITFKRMAIAASVIGLIVLGYFLLVPSRETTPLIVTTTMPDSVEDISPGRSGGILTLANGQQIVLDEKANGTIATEGQVNVVKKDGQLSYEGQNDEGNYLNTLRTPRGRQYHIVLADGSKVWLNAYSSISYPANFSNRERIIEITGEAYFEIEHDASRPFKVKLHDGSQVEVLGTHFNVNSYQDESSIRTTLLEGSVKVTKANENLQLRPGQQAIGINNSLTMSAEVNVEEVMAWKNGYFSFQKAGLKTIMKEISRWYDVDVIYEAGVPEVNFSGDIGRSLTLKQVLSILDETRIHYRLERQKLIIMP